MVSAAGLGGAGAAVSAGASAGGEPYTNPNRKPDGPPSADLANSGGPHGGDSAGSGGGISQGGSKAADSGAGNGGVSLDPDAGSGVSPSGGPAPDLPNDLPGSPVPGNVSCFEASYSGDASFEVRTPTATYVVLRNRGNIISITDELSSQRVQWIGYSDYRPRRVAGILSDQLPNVVTTLDAQSSTARHARLRSESAAGDWLWVWDFYATQATLTI